ncbi:hypothetical protein BN938_0008 [Mucinivorans hirudinis]|uniref:Uncharacterized protein n=1 Tax=Mucinivorans hirudinis TaxID=1433126 RepID=A0A060R5N9_9BACT|nr:hypothetical protein BN938_0008 [Mucinivorans hirudinis]
MKFWIVQRKKALGIILEVISLYYKNIKTKCLWIENEDVTCNALGLIEGVI